MRKLNFGTTFFALFGLIFSVSGALAQPALNTSVTSKKPPQRLEEKAWAVPISFEVAQSTHEATAYERSMQEILNIAPNYKLNSHWGMGAVFTIYRDDSNSEDGHGQSGIGNTLLSTAYSQSITPYMTWKNTFGGTLATDATFREKTTYQGGARLATSLVFTNLWYGSLFSYNLAFGRNVHELTQTADGGFNVRETLTNTMNYDLPIYKKLALQTAFSYTIGQTYLEDMRTKFSFDVGLGYDFAKNFSASIGISNEANALDYNGRDSNIEFYNKNTSMVKFGLTYIL